MSRISCVHVTPESAEEHTPGFVEAFRQAFAGPPYFESYTPEEVRQDIWKPHLEHGIVILALDGTSVIGFGCALPLVEAPTDIQGFLADRRTDGSLPCEPSCAWYMSELGVIPSYQGSGIGYRLIEHRLERIAEVGGSHYVLRTAAAGSNSSHMYEKAGAVLLPGVQDVSKSDQVIVNESQSNQRIYFYGSCPEGIRNLRGRIAA